MKVHAAIVAALVLGFARLGYAALDANSESFLRDTAVSSMGVSELSNWVVDRATPDVANFAKTVVDARAKFNGDLKLLADKYQFTLPMQKMTQDQMDLKDRWEKLATAKFDQEYLNFYINQQTRDIAAFDKVAKDNKDPDLTEFVNKYLPDMKLHLQQARDLDNKLFKKAAFEKPAGFVPEPAMETSYKAPPMKKEVSELDSVRYGENVVPVLSETVEFVGEPVYATSNNGCNTCAPCKVSCCDHKCSDPCNPEITVYENDWRAGATDLIHTGR